MRDTPIFHRYHRHGAVGDVINVKRLVVLRKDEMFRRTAGGNVSYDIPGRDRYLTDGVVASIAHKQAPPISGKYCVVRSCAGWNGTDYRKGVEGNYADAAGARMGCHREPSIRRYRHVVHGTSNGNPPDYLESVRVGDGHIARSHLSRSDALRRGVVLLVLRLGYALRTRLRVLHSRGQFVVGPCHQVAPVRRNG